MILVAGLGNPGPNYINTRHNIGFMLIDELLKEGDFAFVGSSKFKGELYKKGTTLLLKPLTFMNLSGLSLYEAVKFYKPERVVVVHDDLDLNFGAIRFKFGGSNAGHNGLKSIDEMIGTDYERVRLGISKPLLKQSVSNYVLGTFNEQERDHLGEFLTAAKNGVKELIKSDLKSASNKWTIKKGFSSETLC